MSFAHAEKMHAELAEQGISRGDCFATSLDSVLQNKDLPDGFYYDLVRAQTEQNIPKFEGLIQRQVARHFRSDHFTFDTLINLSVYAAPGGNPLKWGPPSDPYEVVPNELAQLLEEYPKTAWESAYELFADEESSSERRQRANSAIEDMYKRLGIFVVTRNMIMDGITFMPVHMESVERDSHVFAVIHNGLNDLHVINNIFAPDSTEEYSYRPLVRSPHLDLTWLCGLESNEEMDERNVNMYGDPYTQITNSDIPIDDEQGETWKYAVYPVPPQK